MAEVDSLEIKIASDAKIANQAIKSIIDNLDNLSKALNIDTSKLANIGKAINANGITMGRISANVDDKGFRNLQEQITYTEKYAEALKNRINDVNKAAQNTTGLKNVENGAKEAAKSFQSLSKNSLKASNSLKKVQTSLKGVLSALLPILGIREIMRFGKESIKSSMDYLEILNYFDAAFRQVAVNANLSAFEEMGYDSAEAYYNSFVQRAEQFTAKMSGFIIGEEGLLQSTGTISLGLDPSQLMNYQAMFSQMSSSMGVSSENALKLSQALTEIGADLASVKNMDFEDVWNDMASGLAGMSRTLDKYGVNIRNVNLQQKLNELGINVNISALNQNDKALLRAIILLENTKYAWGDLADTINQPANQLRLIEANFQNLSRTIGNLFLPVVKTVLPYINALVIAVQRLFAWLGNLIGIDISDISTSIGSTDVSGFLDQTDDLADSLGGVAANAKKAKAGLRAFDELKTISIPEDSKGGAGAGGIGSGLLDAAFNDAFSKYQQEWDRAFAGLENRAQEVADKIEKAFEPIKKIIQDFAIGDFFQAGKDTSALVASIFNFFAEAIDKVDWYGIGKKIGDFFAGIDWFEILKSVGNLIWQALKAAFELYVGAFSSAPLETALISLVAFPKLLKAITASKFITGIGKLWKNFGIWGEKIQLVAGALTGNKAAASGLAMLYPKLGAKVDKVRVAFSNFGKSVSQKGFWKTIDNGITNIRNNLSGLQKGAIVAVAGFAEFSVVSNSIEKLTIGTENWITEIGKIAGVVAAAGAAMYVALGPAGLAITAITGVIAATKGMEDAHKKALESFAEERELLVYGDNLSNITERLNESAQATRDRMSTSIEYVQNAGIGEMQMAKDLADKYFELYEKEYLTNEETEEMQRLAGLLIEKAPELNQYYDEQTGLINGTRDAINDVIEARLKEIQLNAVSEKLTEAYKERVDVLNELAEAAEIASNAQDEMKKAQEEYDESLKIADALNAYSEVTELIRSGHKELDDSARNQAVLNQAINAGTTATSDLVELQNQLKKILEENGEKLPNSIAESTVRVNNILQESQEKLDIFSENYSEAWASLSNQESALEAVESTISQLDQIMSDGMKGVGKDFGEGYEEGILKKVQSVKEAAEEMAEAGIYSVQEVNDSHSPSVVAFGLGKDFTDGYNLGIESNTKRTIMAVSRYAKSVIDKFSELTSQLNQIGVDAMQGLLNGLASMEDSLYEKAIEIANNIANTIKKALDIHSPSRVMFELGNFTMQGFENGLENKYNSIMSSVKDFNYNFQTASAPSISDMYQSYQYHASDYILPHDTVEYWKDGYSQNNSETNRLLRELLSELKKGHVIELDGGVVAGRTREIANTYMRSKGEPYFEI